MRLNDIYFVTFFEKKVTSKRGTLLYVHYHLKHSNKQ